MKITKTNIALYINLLISIILTLTSHTAAAQIFDDDQNPPSVKWKQIQTPSFQIIFPEDFEQEAQRVTNLLESTIEKVSKSIGRKPRKISIILQNRDVNSNGFVQLAPRRSEFITTPPQQSDYQDWLNGLAIHEFRHVVQFDKLTGYLSAPLFEQLALAIFGITLPPWFYEGDAVGIETSLTNAGRGRLPSWESPFRTNTLSGYKYSYQKDYLGSFKNVTPGYYQLGYFMTTKIRREQGPGALDSLMTRIAKNPFRPYNFSNSLKKLTGYNTKEWHQKTVSELDSIWRTQMEKTSPINYPILPLSKPREIVDFLLPVYLPNGRLLALQKSNHSVPKIISISSDGLTEIVKTGIQLQPHFSYGGGKITWDELRYDKRYLKRTYQVINVYDLERKTYKQLTSKTRLFSPTLSIDGEQVAALEIGLDNRFSVVVFDAETGQEKQKIMMPEQLIVQTPNFNKQGTKIVATALSQSGSNLIEVDLQTSATALLLDWQAQQIERPIYLDSNIVFKAHYNGVDNLYLFSCGNKKIAQLTNTLYGGTNPSLDRHTNRLYFNNYQMNGYLISHINLDSTGTVDISNIQNHFIDYFKPIREQETPLDTVDLAKRKTFISEPYKDHQHLFNFHSISPVGDDISSIDNFDLGLQLMSDNLLNTFSTRVGFNYDQNISRTDYFVSASFKRWFPKITIQYRNQAQLSSVRVQNRPDERLPLRWREHYTDIMTTIPLTFNRLNTIYNTGFAVGTSYTKRYQLSLENLSLPNFLEVRFPLVLQYYFNRNSRRSLLDLAPKWGQNFNFVYRNMAFDRRLNGNILSMRTSFYFPGLVNNHSLQLRFNAQQKSGDYSLNNEIPLVSGYDELTPTFVNNTLLMNYRFPIAYPDWDIGPLAFIKRLRGGVFADFENFAQKNRISPRTFGLELRTDFNLLRFYLPNFDAGIKAIYVNEPNPRKVVFTYGVTYTY